MGAQREDLTGAVVYYTSDDRRTWTFGAEIEFSDTSLHALGYMFECPILFSLRDQANGELFDVLMFCPQGMESERERYNNIFQCGYVVGHLRGNFFEVFTPFTEFDSGFEFYAPQVMSNVGDENHVVLMAWLGNADEDDHPSWDFRWMHMLTYPRALTLQRGKILQQPVKQLDQALLLQPVTLTEEGAIAELVGARTFRIQASLDVSQQPVVLSLWDTRGKALAITVDQSALIVDRAGSRYTVGGELRRRSVSPRTVHTFELLFDGSALEIFFDDGAEAFTGRVYLHESLEGVLFQTAEGFSAEAQVEKLLMGQL
ncbi:GH32 C-terminal domain-containing protein [uncultured Rothia sp.]|uniref:glycoside hydrolase family 32 protein n=1 Tax=uncultured Rothia sp. TaxID=316088 RepID=UPI0032179F4C